MSRRRALLALLLASCARSPPPGAPVILPVAAPATPPAEWRPLFDGQALGRWRPTTFGADGAVAVEDGRIVLHQGDPLTGITWGGELPARGDYELALEASKLAGSDFFCGLTFPVGRDSISLIVGGWGGTVVGLSSLDGQDASENETTRTMSFDRDRWYRIRVRVGGGRIQAFIDDEKVADVATAGRQIGVRPEVDASRPLGIAAFRTKAAVRAIAWRPLSSR